MKSEELKEILRLHKLWLDGDQEGEYANMIGANLRDADMRYANLRDADMRYANLRDADMRDADMSGANLRDADMRDANMDFACWPLWCGSLGAKVCVRIARQLAYHFCRLDCDDPEYIKARNTILPFANKFHRVAECGLLERIEEDGEK